MDTNTGKRTADQAGLTSESDSKKTAMELPATEASRASNTALARTGGTASHGSGETPISMNVPRELGVFTETRTTILPLKFGFSFNKINNSRGISDLNWVKIRMNSPYNILKDTTFVAQTESAATSLGPSVNQANAYGTNSNPLTSFQCGLTLPTGQTSSVSGSGVVATAQIIPAWREWYAKMYEAYTVIETEYRVTFINPETTIGNRVVVYTEKDTYGSSSTGNVIPLDRYPFNYENWKHIDKTIVYERNNNDAPGWIKTISGVWKPNTWAKNVKNDEDTKTWSASGAEPDPAYTENLVLIAKPDEHCVEHCNLNVWVELRFVVQWKDLNVKCRYPYYGNDLTSALNISDACQVPYEPYAWGSSV